MIYLQANTDAASEPKHRTPPTSRLNRVQSVGSHSQPHSAGSLAHTVTIATTTPPATPRNRAAELGRNLEAIAKLLDNAGVPRSVNGDRLTVTRRVEWLTQAGERHEHNGVHYIIREVRL